MKLIVYRNEDIVSEIDLGREQIVSSIEQREYFIGRSQDCHIQLNDPQVSRYHALLVQSKDKWEISKYTEIAELIINNVAVSKKDLIQGDIISIAPFQIRVTELEILSTLSSSSTEEETESMQLPTELKESQEVKEEVPLEEVVVSDENSSGLGEEQAVEAQEGGEDQEGMLVNYEEEHHEDYGDSSSGEDQTDIINVFAQYQLIISGEFAPYDKYLLEEGDCFIGRNSKSCQIYLQDEEVSSVHAVIHKNKSTLILEDLNSGNGTLLNGARINKAPLSLRDEFAIGSTSFVLDIVSHQLVEHKDALMPVDENQVVEVEEVVEEEVDFGAGGDTTKSSSTPKSKSLFSAEALKDPQQRKKLIYIVVGLLLLLLFLPEEEVKKSEDTKDKVAQQGKEGNGPDSKDAKDQQVKKGKKKRELTPEEIQYVEAAYNKARDLYEQGLYSDAEIEINKVLSVSDYHYREAEQLRNLIVEGYQRIKLEEEKKQKEEEEKKKQKLVEELLAKAHEAVDKKDVALSEALFTKILEIDPEQKDVPLMRMEIDAWRKEQERLKMEAAMREGYRTTKEKDFDVAKGPYLKKDWFMSIASLERFLNNFDKNKDPALDSIMTEELRKRLSEIKKEASDYLSESKKNLQDIVDPLLEKARALKEGQDLKGAYEVYTLVLKSRPDAEEALNELRSINEMLTLRAQRIYREAIISDSMNMSKDAEDKYQEVLQVAPSDSDYYRKAKEKLKKFFK